MSKLFSVALLGILFFTFGALRAQDCSECRYAIPVFDSVLVDTGIKFAEGINSDGVNQSLYMDVYSPYGDTSTARPIFIFAFGGAFVQGKRNDQPIIDACKRFARAGYVAVSIDYRIVNTDNINGLLAQVGIYGTDGLLTRTFFMAMQEMRASVQYMKANFAEMGNTWKVDTGKVFLSGVSSGGITALNVAYCNTPEELSAMKGISAIDDLGGFYSTSGPHKTYSWRPTAVIPIAGALYTLDWLNPGEPPAILVQGDQDDVVPYKQGSLDLMGLLTLPLNGCFSVDSIARVRGVCSYLYTIPGAKHNITDINPIYFEYVFHQFLPRLKAVVHNKTFCSQGVIEAHINPGPVIRAELNDPLDLNLELSGSEANPKVRWCTTAPCSFTSTDRNIQTTAKPTQFYIALAQNDGYLATDFVTVTNDTSIHVGRSATLWPDLKVYPNPTNGAFTVSADEAALGLTLVSMTGQTVWSRENYATGAVVDLSALPAGLYTLRIRGAARETYSKLIVR